MVESKMPQPKLLTRELGYHGLTKIIRLISYKNKTEKIIPQKKPNSPYKSKACKTASCG